MSTKTVVFDLDDTLIPEIEYLKSAFREISQKVDPKNSSLYEKMLDWYKNKENVFQKITYEYDNYSIGELKTSYRNHFPEFNSESLSREIIIKLKEKGYTIGLITDGFSITQRNKIRALDIESLFDLIIISEEFGSEKPNFKNYEVFDQFNSYEKYYIGDNVSKDFITPNQLGWKTICLIDNGENIHLQDFNKESIYLPNYSVQNLQEILTIIN